MRYTIESKDDEMMIGQAIAKWVESGKVLLIEKSDPLEVLKENLHRVKRSLEILERAGIDKDVIFAYLQAKTHLPQRDIRTFIRAQDEFFKKLGVTLK